MSVSRTISEIFSVIERRDLENWVRGCSRSLKMVPFDGPYTTLYWSAIVNIVLSCTIFSYLTLNNIVTLKSGLEVFQGHSNWHHSKAWMRFPIRLPWLSLSFIIFEIKRDITGKPLHSTPPLGTSPSEYFQPVSSYRKLEW